MALFSAGELVATPAKSLPAGMHLSGPGKGGRRFHNMTHLRPTSPMIICSRHSETRYQCPIGPKALWTESSVSTLDSRVV